MSEIVSFLLGSGFSIPEGLPGVQKLNARLSKIDESEIMIHSSMVVIWLNGQEDPNRFMNWDQRYFLQDFLIFYSSEVLADGAVFHYETFYDYYSGYLFREENKKEIERFYRGFGAKYYKGKRDDRSCIDRINDFNNAFNQLLAAQLSNVNYLQDVGLSNYPHYGGIFPFLCHLVKVTKVKVHTLNHDLFFDFVASKLSGLWEHYSDGFQLEGSPYYGNLQYRFPLSQQKNLTKSYKVKLSRFTDKFDTRLALYKLHGSVFTSIVYTKNEETPVIRLKNDYSVSQYFEEKLDPNTGDLFFDHLFDQVHPDFLSGTTNKTRYYTQDPYYVKLLGYFQANLIKSEILFVIGYGFQDSGINDYLEKNFLKRGGTMVVIGPTKPNTDFIERYGGIHIPKSVVDVSYEEYEHFLPDNLKIVQEKRIDEPSHEELNFLKFLTERESKEKKNGPTK